jgi:hypothetical protein
MPVWWRPPSPPPRRDRLIEATALAMLVGAAAGILGLGFGAIGGCLDGARTPSAVRDTMVARQAIPWRHFTGDNGYQRCDLWVSQLGMAEIFCGGRVVYRGFGRDPGDGRFHALPLYQPERARYDHDVTRSADIAFDHTQLGAFERSGRGEMTIGRLREVHP